MFAKSLLKFNLTKTIPKNKYALNSISFFEKLLKNNLVLKKLLVMEYFRISVQFKKFLFMLTESEYQFIQRQNIYFKEFVRECVAY
ncbi:hypothetical protein BpHYR1_018531 [Brachionus plicatilis]|uniref:Uncharacterized protein n=1 Tax=Brachionus plicatilis TaxID=10195 RepID=A0A3M7RSW7_BRAPC|nr:hypothetical protein BpHYR1_018531 [Brachionus plicatilis]